MSLANQQQADALSLNCFLNAFVREFDHWYFSTNNGGQNGCHLHIPTIAGEFQIPVRYRSICGRHQFAEPIIFYSQDTYLQDNDSGIQQSFADFCATLIQSLNAEHCHIPVSQTARECFIQRVQESRKNIAHSLATRDDTPSLFVEDMEFSVSEQSLLAGHSVHPAPKIRAPMAQDEVQRYGAEGKSHFPLIWVAVRKTRLHYVSADHISLAERCAALLAADDTLTSIASSFDKVLNEESEENYIALPIHPWQFQQLQQLPVLREAFKSGDIKPLADNGCQWSATSSIRAIYTKHAPYMLKYSLSVRLTNSIRHLQPAELERGSLISRILSTPMGQELRSRFANFTLIEEPAYCCLLDTNQQTVVESALVFRQNPFQGILADQHYLLAGLTQDNPQGGPCRLTHAVKQVAALKQLPLDIAAELWFEGFLQCVVKPLVIAQADYGLLFGAHQQNIILQLNNGWPCHGYFRDCQGTGFSQLGVDTFSLAADLQSQAAGNQISDLMANRLFAYYLIINTTFSVISSLGADNVIEETRLLHQLKHHLTKLLESGVKDPQFLHYVLGSEQLWLKGNFICSLADINENTMSNPLDIYRPIANPLAKLSETTTTAVSTAINAF